MWALDRFVAPCPASHTVFASPRPSKEDVILTPAKSTSDPMAHFLHLS